MPYEFKFPDVGEGIQEGVIQKWMVKVGDEVEADAPLGEIETDKAVVEMPSPKSGTIGKIHVKEGDTIKVGETMVTILLEGESSGDVKKAKKKTVDEHYTGSVVGFLEEAKGIQPITQSSKKEGPTADPSKIKATPAVRILAKKKGIDLSSIKGTGPDGSVTIHDLNTVPESTVTEVTETSKKDPKIKVQRKYDMYGYVDREKIHGIKKAVADKMTESLFTAPQVTNMGEADATALWKLRNNEKPKFEKEKIHLTFMPYIVRAVQLALAKHPHLNASVEGEEIIIKKYFNIGIAVDTEKGLMVPVLKRADQKSIKEIAVEINKLATDSRSRKINLMDLKGGTFTISNLGSVGVQHFTPVLNYPETGILGIGRITDKAVVVDGKIEIRKILPVSVTYDHRAADGGQAARFMVDLISLLENPKELKK
tara:strand:+ start:190 stop:1464 length:1275 start_codon:yes stop_codon:yes gene_type:complete